MKSAAKGVLFPPGHGSGSRIKTITMWLLRGFPVFAAVFSYWRPGLSCHLSPSLHSPCEFRHLDLQRIVDFNMLSDSAIVVGDNVLRPGGQTLDRCCAPSGPTFHFKGTPLRPRCTERVLILRQPTSSPRMFEVGGDQALSCRISCTCRHV